MLNNTPHVRGVTAAVTRIAIASALGGVLVLAGPGAGVAGIVVNGSLSDWGLTLSNVASPGGTHWTATADGSYINTSACPTDAPYAPTCNTAIHPTDPGYKAYGYHAEDSNDSAPLINGPSGTGYIGPDYGGQKYDAEFIAGAVFGNKLSIGISSGIRPDNGFTYYAPGDIKIVISKNGGPAMTFGLEVGGGAGCAPGDLPPSTPSCAPASAVNVAASNSPSPVAGTTYGLTSGGETASANTSALKVGSIYKADSAGNWYLDPIGGCEPDYYGGKPSDCEFGGQQTTQLLSGSFVTTADYTDTMNDMTSPHAVIEASFDLTQLVSYDLGDQLTVGLFWGPSCGNDRLGTGLSFIESTPHNDMLSAPGGILLYGTGVFLLQWHRRRRRTAPAR